MHVEAGNTGDTAIPRREDIVPAGQGGAAATDAGASAALLTDYRLQQRDYLLRIARAMTARLDLADVLELVIRSAVTMTNGEAGAIALRHADGTLEVVASYRLDSRLTLRLERILGSLGRRQVGGTEAARPEPLAPSEPAALSEAAAVDLAVRPAPDRDADGRHLLTLPLAMSGSAIGQILILRSEGASVFTPLDSSLLAAFADQAAVAIQNASLHERLAARERQLAALVEHSVGGVILADADGTVTAHNPAAGQMASCGAGGLVGCSLADLRLVAEDGGVMPLPLPADPGTERTARGHLLGDAAHGPFVQATVSALAGAGGAVGGYVADLVDLTDYKAAEDAKTTFLAGLSHDLKTPLALIRGYAETLEMESVRGDDALFAEAVHVILDESRHLADTVERMLRAARMQMGAFTLDLDTVDVGALVERMVAEMRTAVPDRRWQVHVAPGASPITADRARLREALANLLDNAVRYSGAGSAIWVTVEPWSDGVALAVRDEGVGIAREDHERVFERFARAGGAGEGAGLGLFMTRTIVGAHGGTIELESAPGKGSTFRILLPGTPPRAAVP
jgi:signal transduction histidine kinase